MWLKYTLCKKVYLTLRRSGWSLHNFEHCAQNNLQLHFLAHNFTQFSGYRHKSTPKHAGTLFYLFILFKKQEFPCYQMCAVQARETNLKTAALSPRVSITVRHCLPHLSPAQETYSFYLTGRKIYFCLLLLSCLSRTGKKPQQDFFFFKPLKTIRV